MEEKHLPSHSNIPFTGSHLIPKSRPAHKVSREKKEASYLRPGFYQRTITAELLHRIPTRDFLFRLAQTGRLLDILRCQGQRGLQAFMESLEFYHPEQFTQLTGQQPTQRCSLILGKQGRAVAEASVQALRRSDRVSRCSITCS